jgi:hypothetical protein
MKTFFAAWWALSAVFAFTSGMCGQENSTGPKDVTAGRETPLVLTGAIPLENAKGRFDHFASGKGRLFVSALGSNAVAVINLRGQIPERTIAGIPESARRSFFSRDQQAFRGQRRRKSLHL